jgi:hypothetical protein
MKINNSNFLKNFGPTPEQLQKALQADQAAKNLRGESIMADKLKKYSELTDIAARKVIQEGPEGVRDEKEAPPKEFGKKKDRNGTDPEGSRPEDENDTPPPPGTSRIDIRV